uniref:Chemokine interleukin-8-like domain-containing protein n=1 Tax=Periophthalmus magnuspinnatus TaxID=409849 RepID=A0A3B3ZGX4_9GOBI
MGHSLAPAVLLCLITWIASLHITSGYSSKCCIKNKNVIVRLDNIVGYKVQPQGFCPIMSVAFLTKQNKWICWDPEEPYAQRAMQKVDQLRHTQQQREVTVPPTAKEMTVVATNMTNTTIRPAMV